MMQETCNNCLGLKNRSTALRQAKTSKQECQNVTAVTFRTLLLHFGSTFFQTETIVASFWHRVVLFFKVLSNHSSKRQFLVLHCHLEK